MKTRRADSPCDYRGFEDPYSGLAAMIIVQAETDLQLLGSADVAYFDGVKVSKMDIQRFFRSGWGFFLASGVGISEDEYRRYVLRVVEGV